MMDVKKLLEAVDAKDIDTIVQVLMEGQELKDLFDQVSQEFPRKQLGDLFEVVSFMYYRGFMRGAVTIAEKYQEREQNRRKETKC